MKRWLALPVLTSILLGFSAGPAVAQEEVRIGVILPLTGAAASTGLELKNAAELAAEIVNQDMKDLSLPLAAGAGLPNLKGAKVKLVFADHQGNPQVGATEAERLITQEKVAALGGCWWPLFITPHWMQFLAKLTPHGWATTGFNKLMLFGGDWSSVTWEIVALAGFSAAFIIIGILKFRASADQA